MSTRSNPHSIFPTKRREDVFGLRLYQKGETLQEFDPHTPFAEVKAWAASHGDGHYTVSPLDEHGKRYRAYKPFDIDEGERKRAAELAVVSKQHEQAQALTFVDSQLEEMRREREKLRQQQEKLQEEMKAKGDKQQAQEKELIRDFFDRQEQSRREDDERRREHEAERRAEEEARRLEHTERMAALRQEETGFLAQQSEVRDESLRRASDEREARLRRDFDQQLNFLRQQYDQQAQFLKTTFDQQLQSERTQHARELEALKLRGEELDRLREAEHKLSIRTERARLEKEFGWGQEKIPTDVRREMLFRKLDREYPEPTPLERIFERLEPAFERLMEFREALPGNQGQLPSSAAALPNGGTRPEAGPPGAQAGGDDLPEVFEM